MGSQPPGAFPGRLGPGRKNSKLPLDNFPRSAIIAFVPRGGHENLAGLCKGSTTDSDSVCEGSNPSPAAKKRSTCIAGASFFGTRDSLKCSGEMNSPCAEVLPAAKRSNAAKAARPRRAVGQVLRQLIQNLKYLDCSDLPKQKATAFAVAFCFGFRRPLAASPLRYLNARGGGKAAGRDLR